MKPRQCRRVALQRTGSILRPPLACPRNMSARSEHQHRQLGRRAPGHLTNGPTATKTLRQGSARANDEVRVRFTQLYLLNARSERQVTPSTISGLSCNDAREAKAAVFKQPPAFPGATVTTTAKTCSAFSSRMTGRSSSLTLSAGLRYSYFGPLTDKDTNQRRAFSWERQQPFEGISIRTGIPAWNSTKANFGRSSASTGVQTGSRASWLFARFRFEL